MDRFLVTEPSDMKERGWAELDFVLISGDAYVDHPSFAPAVIGRYLESKGYRVGIIDQPDWNDVEAFKKLGKPRGLDVTGMFTRFVWADEDDNDYYVYFKGNKVYDTKEPNYKDISYNVIRYDWSENNVTLSTQNTEIGMAKEDVAVEFKGTPFTISFNGRYISDILRHSTGDNIHLFLKQNGPVVIRQDNNPNYTYVVTPVRTNA